MDDHLDAGVADRPRARGRLVRRGVVDDVDPVDEVRDPPQGLGDEMLLLERGHDDGDTLALDHQRPVTRRSARPFAGGTDRRARRRARRAGGRSARRSGRSCAGSSRSSCSRPPAGRSCSAPRSPRARAAAGSGTAPAAPCRGAAREADRVVEAVIAISLSVDEMRLVVDHGLLLRDGDRDARSMSSSSRRARDDLLVEQRRSSGRRRSRRRR